MKIYMYLYYRFLVYPYKCDNIETLTKTPPVIKRECNAHAQD